MKTRAAVSGSAATPRAETPADVQIYSAGAVGIGVAAFAIGIWAVASLIGGLVASGGPLGLARDWFTAVFGV